ncbi:MAG: lipopolysaccharide/colanic/teichoic acid biosynthesis glycosyltransferase [Flavobacteriales bacterium]|jgi:lipopolysaccharide/colanic/teichoic acid biosynthesis glycosyltransferase
MKRVLDILFALLAVAFLLLPGLIIALMIKLGSKGGVFFKQIRVGKEGSEFSIIKFRSMKPESESTGQLTVGERDPRITRIGQYLRKSKLDETPQLFNIIKGEMSIVGPRPEVPKYVSMYTTEQRQVLAVRPGLTDLASLEYFEENRLLGESMDPEQTYIDTIMPHKLSLNMKYIKEKSLLLDAKIIWLTIKRILGV